MGNAGDTYDFSPVEGDDPILLHPDLVQVKKSTLIEEIILSGNFQLPKILKQEWGNLMKMEA
ncbi:hypothetical protein ACIL82_10455 [Enterococcus faecium]